MTDQTHPQLTDALIERMLLERAGPGAPADLVAAMATEVESTGQWSPGLLGTRSWPAASRTRRVPRRTWLFVAAALVIGTGVVGTSMVGGRLVAPNPAPTMPVAIASPTTVPSAVPSASASPSASPDDALRIDDAAYLAGDPFTLSVGEAGADWTAPSAAPVMPNGQRAARVAFLPASCATGNFRIYADAAPEDAWETSLRADFGARNYTMGSWPGAQVPECANGHVWTYLQVGYHPFAPLGTIHLVAQITNVNNAPAAVQVVPVFTSADATMPWLTSTGFIATEPVSGPEKPRSAKAQEIFAEGFARTTLPDGTTPTQWGFELTGCGPVGPKPVVITARVGGAAPIEVGRCSDGSILTGTMSLPLPADGTQASVLMAGGTTKSQVRVSEFQWRGDRP